MKKLLVSMIAATLLAGGFAFVVEAQQAHRGGGGGRGHAAPNAAAAAAPVEAAPPSAAIGEAMGDLRWGMKKEEVYAYFQNRIRDRYRPQLSKAPGAIEEDRIRARMQEELQKLHDDEVCFQGRRTGWDASYLREEFTHNNSECMLVVNESDSQNFYFFINDHFWKWYKAFNADAFGGQNFAQFSDAIQHRFGPAREASGELVHGDGVRHWIEWQDEVTRLRAVDQQQFYGFFCLVFEEKQTLNNLTTLRHNVAQSHSHSNTLVDIVTNPAGRQTATDDNADIVDRLTGKNRNPTQAAPNAPTKNNGAAPRGQQSPAPQAPTKRGADALDL